MTFDSVCLAAINSELQELIGGKVQHIAQPSPAQVSLSVFKPGLGEKKLLLDCSARFCRVHFTDSRSANPFTPPAFCAALRKHVEGARVVSISQRGFDRVLDIRLRKDNEEFLLCGEFMGRHANLILVSQNKQVLHAAKLVNSKQSRVRPVLPGSEYSPPPFAPRPDPRIVSRESFLEGWQEDEPADFSKWLRGRFDGMSTLLAKEIVSRVENPNDAENCWQAFDDFFAPVRNGDWNPAVWQGENGAVLGAYPLRLKSVEAPQQGRPSVSAALDEYFRFAIENDHFASQRNTLVGALKKTLSRQQHVLEQVARGAAEGDRAATYRHWGELLYAHLHSISGTPKSVQVEDFYNGEQLEIPLNEDFTPAQNAARYFEKAKHAEQNSGALKARSETLQVEIAEIESALEQVQSAADEESVECLQKRATQKGWLRAASQTPSGEKKKQQEPLFGGKKVRSFTSPDGYEVLVGENAQANEYLVTRLSHSNDWWLHLRAGTSSHAIIKTNNAPDRVPSSTLLFAARLVVARSAAKHAGLASVDYTLRKYVRKPRKAAPGSVQISNEKTLNVLSG